MKQHARAIILVLAVVGLVASAASLYVHYRSLMDPGYTSFCDVNATFNCTDAYTSRFGAFAGAVLGAIAGAAYRAAHSAGTNDAGTSTQRLAELERRRIGGGVKTS